LFCWRTHPQTNRQGLEKCTWAAAGSAVGLQRERSSWCILIPNAVANSKPWFWCHNTCQMQPHMPSSRYVGFPSQECWDLNRQPPCSLGGTVGAGRINPPRNSATNPSTTAILTFVGSWPPRWDTHGCMYHASHWQPSAKASTPPFWRQQASHAPNQGPRGSPPLVCYPGPEGVVDQVLHHRWCTSS
jgi:hypothetical protein